MSLPKPNTEWPTADRKKVTERTAEAQVWWEGSTTGLNDFYAATGRTSPSGIVDRSRQAYAAFWGRLPQQTAQPVKRLHAPIAGDISNLSARALFSEPLTIVAPTDAETRAINTDKAAAKNPLQARADLIFNTPRFHSDLFTAGESCSALGGNYQRIVWDPEIADHAWIDFVDEDHAIPEFRWNRLVAVTFWTELDTDDDRIVLRHFQRYEKGRIVHALYEGTATNVGHPVPLDEHEFTRDIQLDGADDSGTYALLGVDELGAQYVPNKTPNPEWRKHPKLKRLGRSDHSSDVIPLYHELDRIYSSLMRDFRIAAARVYASETVLTSPGRGQGLHLAEDQEMFTSVGSAIGKEGSMESIFEFHQPAIRVLEHDQGGQVLLREVLRRTGYSPMDMGMADEVAQTATEAAGKKELTVQTTLGKSRHWSASLGPLSTTCLRVDAAKFGGVSPSEELELEWPPFARDTALAKSQVVMNWETAGAATTRTKVAYLHEDWDDEKVDEEAAELDAKNVAPDPFGGMPTDGDPNNPPPPSGDDAEDEPTAPEADGGE